MSPSLPLFFPSSPPPLLPGASCSAEVCFAFPLPPLAPWHSLVSTIPYHTMHARRVTRARLRDGDNEPAALEANARGAAGTSASAATNKREERGVKMQNAEAAPVAGNHDAKNKKRTASARNRAAPKGGDAMLRCRNWNHRHRHR